MSIFHDKTLQNIAEVAAKILEGDLSTKQKQIAKISEPKHKIDSGDLAKLRAGAKPVKEESEQLDESDVGNGYKIKMKHIDKGRIHSPTGEHIADVTREHGSGWRYHSGGKDWNGSETSKHYKTGVEKTKMAAARKAAQIHMNEETEQKQEVLQEAAYSAKAARAGKDIGKPGKMFAKIAAGAAKRYGSEERGRKVAGAVLKKLRMKEDTDIEITDEQAEEILEAYEYDQKNHMSFSEMISSYKEQGLKSLVSEEPDNETFTKELEDQKASMMGKKKQPSVAAPSTQGVKEMPEEVEVLDANKVNGVTIETIEERTLSEPETKKKEEVVKSMKKNLAGFKERYGERAKSVMYATATKLAKEESEVPEHLKKDYQHKDGKLIPKIHSKMSPHDHGYDYTMQSIEDAHSKSHAKSQHKEILTHNPHPKGSKEHGEWTSGANKAKDEVLKNWS